MMTTMINIMNSPLAFNLKKFFEKIKNQELPFYGGIIIAIIGGVALVWSIYKIVVGLMSDRQQVNWFKCIVALLLGGALFIGGWTFILGVAQGGHETIDDLGQMILPFIR